MTNEADNNQHLTNGRKQLAEIIEQLTKDTTTLETGIPGLILHRWEHPTDPVSYMHDPSLCLIAQGKKRVVLAEEDYHYSENQFLLSSLDLPIIANIVEASKDRPYLGITYRLNQKEISHLLVDNNLPKSSKRETSKSIGVGDASTEMMDAFIRLVSLIKEPDNINMLAPLIQKEILFRLLMSDQGPRLRELAMAGSKESQIAKAIEWLKKNYNTQLKIENLANHARMSSSSLHQHFREMTNMSPLQYQKWIRLHEARRLMLAEKYDASNAAFEVGYESPSQFSREYKRLFGNPPLRDIKLMSANG
ncbi:MAG: AraC family transcriptional regulator [Deferribacterales bacterium]